MRNRLLFFVGLALLVLAIGALLTSVLISSRSFPRETLTSSISGEEMLPPTVAPSPSLGPVTFSSDFDDEAEEPLNVGINFDYGITRLYAYWPYAGMEEGNPYRWEFYHSGSPFYGDDGTFEHASGHTWQSISSTSGEPLGPGTYRIVIEVGGQVALSDECTIESR
jgi:hypothetical protein